MKTTQKKVKRLSERYITNKNGKQEFVILPIKRYKKMLEILEDYGLAKAIKEAEKERTYSLGEALKLLND